MSAINGKHVAVWPTGTSVGNQFVPSSVGAVRSQKGLAHQLAAFLFINWGKASAGLQQERKPSTQQMDQPQAPKTK